MFSTDMTREVPTKEKCVCVCHITLLSGYLCSDTLPLTSTTLIAEGRTCAAAVLTLRILSRSFAVPSWWFVSDVYFWTGAYMGREVFFHPAACSSDHCISWRIRAYYFQRVIRPSLALLSCPGVGCSAFLLCPYSSRTPTG